MDLQNKLIKLYNEIDELKTKGVLAIVFTEKKVSNLRTLTIEIFHQYLFDKILIGMNHMYETWRLRKKSLKDILTILKMKTQMLT